MPTFAEALSGALSTRRRALAFPSVGQASEAIGVVGPSGEVGRFAGDDGPGSEASAADCQWRCALLGESLAWLFLEERWELQQQQQQQQQEQQQQQQQQHQEQPDPTTAPRNFSGSSGSMGRSTLRSVATSSSVEQAIRADFGGLEVLLGMLRELAVFSDNMGTLSDECLLAVHSVMTMTTPQTSDKADLSRTLG